MNKEVVDVPYGVYIERDRNPKVERAPTGTRTQTGILNQLDRSKWEKDEKKRNMTHKFEGDIEEDEYVNLDDAREEEEQPKTKEEDEDNNDGEDEDKDFVKEDIDPNPFRRPADVPDEVEEVKPKPKGVKPPANKSEYEHGVDYIYSEVPIGTSKGHKGHKIQSERERLLKRMGIDVTEMGLVPVDVYRKTNETLDVKNFGTHKMLKVKKVGGYRDINVKDVKDMSLADIEKQLIARGLSAKGSRAEIVSRLEDIVKVGKGRPPPLDTDEYTLLPYKSKRTIQTLDIPLPQRKGEHEYVTIPPKEFPKNKFRAEYSPGQYISFKKNGKTASGIILSFDENGIYVSANMDAEKSGDRFWKVRNEIDNIESILDEYRYGVNDEEELYYKRNWEIKLGKLQEQLKLWNLVDVFVSYSDPSLKIASKPEKAKFLHRETYDVVLLYNYPVEDELRKQVIGMYYDILITIFGKPAEAITEKELEPMYIEDMIEWESFRDKRFESWFYEKKLPILKEFVKKNEVKLNLEYMNIISVNYYVNTIMGNYDMLFDDNNLFNHSDKEFIDVLRKLSEISVLDGIVISILEKRYYASGQVPIYEKNLAIQISKAIEEYFRLHPINEKVITQKIESQAMYNYFKTLKPSSDELAEFDNKNGIRVEAEYNDYIVKYNERLNKVVDRRVARGKHLHLQGGLKEDLVLRSIEKFEQIIFAADSNNVETYLNNVLYPYMFLAGKLGSMCKLFRSKLKSGDYKISEFNGLNFGHFMPEIALNPNRLVPLDNGKDLDSLLNEVLYYHINTLIHRFYTYTKDMHVKKPHDITEITYSSLSRLILPLKAMCLGNRDENGALATELIKDGRYVVDEKGAVVSTPIKDEDLVMDYDPIEKVFTCVAIPDIMRAISLGDTMNYHTGKAYTARFITKMKERYGYMLEDEKLMKPKVPTEVPNKVRFADDVKKEDVKDVPNIEKEREDVAKDIKAQRDIFKGKEVPVTEKLSEEEERVMKKMLANLSQTGYVKGLNKKEIPKGIELSKEEAEKEILADLNEEVTIKEIPRKINTLKIATALKIKHIAMLCDSLLEYTIAGIHPTNKDKIGNKVTDETNVIIIGVDVMSECNPELTLLNIRALPSVYINTGTKKNMNLEKKKPIFVIGVNAEGKSDVELKKFAKSISTQFKNNYDGNEILDVYFAASDNDYSIEKAFENVLMFLTGTDKL